MEIFVHLSANNSRSGLEKEQGGSATRGMPRGISCPYPPLLRGIVNRASDLQPVLLQWRSPKKILSQECLQGAGAVLCGAKFTRGGKELSSQVPVLGKCICPQIRAFWKLGCIYAVLVSRVSGCCGESRLKGSVGQVFGRAVWGSHAMEELWMLPLLSSGMLKS